MRIVYCLIILCVCFFSCEEAVVPKPKGYLRLQYPEAIYVKTEIDTMPFSFEANRFANKITTKKLVSATESYGVNIEYSTLKGTIYLTYKSIDNSRENLIAFLRDAQNFTQKHTAKADEIKEKEYMNTFNKVYGMFYEVGGNAASQSQFYITDSVNHFLTGSLYFYVKPNYDSILPAAKYLEKDIKHIMESVKWN